MKRVNPYVVMRSVEEVFADYNGRRAGLIQALTTDVKIFYEQCDPNKENLCLYGLPNRTWEVNLPAEDVPPELPEPSLGINFARDGMEKRDWLALVAVHCDSWLLSVAFYFGARFEFGRSERKRLFMMINEQPTVFEAVKATFILTKEHAVSQNNSSSKSKPAGRMPEPETRVKMPVLKDEDENGGDEEEEEGQKEEEEDGQEEDEQGSTLCGACGENYASDEFWICCDICETWFHGNCVKITPAKAEQIKHYECPDCSGKRARV